MKSAQRGWSLIELLVVMAIAIILGLTAVPSLSSVLKQMQVRNAAQEFASWTAMARSEAIKRRQGRVVMCVASSIDACDKHGNWHMGWLLFHDLNGNSQLDAEDAVIRYQSALAEGLSIRGNTHVAHYVAYSSAGRASLVSGGLQMGTWSFCHLQSPSTTRWQLVLSATGRVRMVSGVSPVC
jgi:type IV fimbrial biogenesis protein FimT